MTKNEIKDFLPYVSEGKKVLLAEVQNINSRFFRTGVKLIEKSLEESVVLEELYYLLRTYFLEDYGLFTNLDLKELQRVFQFVMYELNYGKDIYKKILEIYNLEKGNKNYD